MIIYERIYKALDKLLPDGIESFCSDPEGYAKLQSKGYMDLNIDVQNWKEKNKKTFRISMAHNSIQNGDVMCNPDMEIRIHREAKMAEALTFQNDYVGVFNRVYKEGDENMVNMKMKKELNSFLNQWLKNIKMQGHK